MNNSEKILLMPPFLQKIKREVIKLANILDVELAPDNIHDLYQLINDKTPVYVIFGTDYVDSYIISMEKRVCLIEDEDKEISEMNDMIYHCDVFPYINRKPSKQLNKLTLWLNYTQSMMYTDRDRIGMTDITHNFISLTPIVKAKHVDLIIDYSNELHKSSRI